MNTNNHMVTPGGPDDDDQEEEKRDIASEIEFLKEIFPNFEVKVIEKVLLEIGQFDKTFKHLQEFFELVTENQFVQKGLQQDDHDFLQQEQ